MEDDLCFASYKALQIPCILQQVFQYLPHTDLKRSRLVSRVFNDEANRILRKRSKIVLNSSKRLIAFYLEKFSDVHTFCEGFQLVNVHVATPSMQIFLDSFGKSIKSLDLRDSKWTFTELKQILMRASSQLEEVIIHGLLPKECWATSSSVPIQPHPPPRFEEGLGRILFMHPRIPIHNPLQGVNGNGNNRNLPAFLRAPSPEQAPVEQAKKEVETVEDKEVLWLPKVKRLDLQLYDKLPEDDFLQDFIVKILSSTINLEILRSSESRRGKSRRERFHRILFETLIDTKFNFLLPNLTKIDFALTPWGDDQYQRLSSKNFPLNYLSLTILPDISTVTVVKLLSSFKKTLTKLKIAFTSWQIMEFPYDLGLEHVRHLSLDWYNGSLKFVTYMKSLETLILAQVDLNDALRDELYDGSGAEESGAEEQDDADSEVRKFLCQRRHRLLTSFELYQPSGAEIFPESVRKLSGIFPNLKKLVLGKLTDQSLRAVFTVFPGLEEFSAIEGTFSDEGVTGIAVQPCHICDKQHLTELCRGVYNEGLINSQRRHCFIGDLRNLRKLELRAPTLTNLSIYHGILQCKRLRSLTLRSFHLTYGSLRRVVDMLNLEYLESTHSFTHAAEIKYALRKMTGRTFILNGIEAPREYCRCSAREIENYISNFSPFISSRSVVSIPKDDPRTIRYPLGLILNQLTQQNRR
ncbi:unnamed protein product [Orchesella dallaii]|uniref:F-box domain-containing protein n=1 Tax=Orchesella dallaii TaxID=48710 RepID=A0ABP1QFM6_9HEXA